MDYSQTLNLPRTDFPMLATRNTYLSHQPKCLRMIGSEPAFVREERCDYTGELVSIDGVPFGPWHGHVHTTEDRGIV